MAGLSIAIANSISSNYVVGSSYDPDAQAFFIAEGAAGVTLTTTEMNAVNTLVVDLKGYNLWTKSFALYPFIGSTATSQKFNLKNPADTNAAYRLSFVGGWTHSSNGALPNGTNAFANTFLSTSAIGLNSGHISYYSRTNNTTVSCEVGGGNPSPDSYTLLELRNASALGAFRYNNGVAQNQVAIADTRGFFIGTRTASNVIKLFRNNTNIINGSAASNATSVFSQYIAAYNGSNTAYSYSNRQCAFASIGTGLTDTEAANFYNAVQNFQTTLGRQV
jgi:hypothetical protein